MDATRIFRKVALDRISSPEQLDQLLRVTTPRTWLVLVALVVCLGAGVGWGIWGEVATTVSGEGVLLRSGTMQRVVAMVDGDVLDVRVRAGDHVAAGQIVALVGEASRLERIRVARAALARAAAPATGAPSGAAPRATVADLAREIAGLEQQLQIESAVASPFAGHVVTVAAEAGQAVRAGALVLTLRPDADTVEALVSLSPDQAARVRAGMDAEIVPAVARREEHGFLRGTVASLVPSAADGARGAVVVRVTLVRDAATPSGYRWSSRQGAPVVLAGGTRCTGVIVTRRQRPIGLVIPGLDATAGAR